MADKGDTLRRLIHDAPTDMTPERDLWPSIAKGLDAPTASSPSYWRPVAIASTLLLALLVGKISFSPEAPEGQNDALLHTLAAIEAQHQTNIAALTLTKQVDWKTSPYSQPVEQGIEQLRTAAKEIYEALKLNPTDKQLWQLWLWTQQREIELIKQGQKLPVNRDTTGEII
ncbi:hypothetical protein L2712_09620 [Shewanella marisflavi]|uniref:hypothetical protein n=1 Tax=Shewanella marisflavi TaxID=260364 RepID=UPI002010AEB0|nr:hypothetical protein [Shewanella marisflavi]MCL1041896.1 hypothetical protein [Shewanella marisflavi]